MTTWRKVGCCLIAAVAAFGAFADGESEIREGQLWTYNASTRKLTEIVEDGVTPWVIHIDGNGAIDSTSVGANPVVDLRKATFPDGVPDILAINHGQNIFRQRTTLETIYLPDTCRQLKSHTFYYSSKLANVYFPQNPGGNFSAGADASGGTFLGTVVREAVLPRTMKTLGGYIFRGVSTLKRVVLPDDVVSIDTTAFQDCSGINEIEWRNWVTNVMNKTTSPFPKVGNLNCRHIVPGDNPDWARFIWDPAKVTPWAKCAESEKTTYFTRYGENAAVPVGISASGAAGFNRGYIVTSGTRIIPIDVAVADARTGSVTLDPPLPDSGFYTDGDVVRVTFTPAADSAFVHWEGVPEGIDATASEITVTIDRKFDLTAVACSSSYELKGGELTDGYTTMSCSGSGDAIVITGLASAPGTLDLSKPVIDGAIVGIGASAFSSTKGLTRVVLPATLEEIGATAFPNTVTEIVWNGSPVAWADNAFASLTANNARFLVPGDNPDWARFIWDPAKVTPWAKCEESEKATYFLRYGEGAAVPFGISVSGATGLNRVYIVTDGTSCGVPFGATVADARTGSITLDPALPDSGFYPEGTQVRVTFTPAADSTFVHWKGTTEGIDVDAAEITVTADRLYALVAVACSSSYYAPDGTTLTDGYTTLSCSGSGDEIVVTGVVSAPGTIDLSKPVTGGTIAGIGPSAFASVTGPTRVILPWNLAETVCDAAKVMPWAKVDAADKAVYSAGFGADAAEPVGMGVGGGLSGVWIIPRPANGLKVAALPRQHMGAQPTPAVTTADGETVADVEYAYVSNDAPGLAAVIATVTAGAHEGEKAVGYYTVGTVSHSDTYTWKATASGNWEDVANWQSASGDAGYPQLPDDVAVLPLTTDDTTVTATVNEQLEIASLAVGLQEGQLLVGKIAVEFKTGLVTNEIGAVTVTKNGILTQYGPLKTESHGVILKCASMTVASGGTVSVVGKGYTYVSNGTHQRGVTAFGPGSGRDNGRYGGLSSEGYAVGKCYGSIRNPTNYGSSVCWSGKSSPGMIQLFVSGQLTVDGTLTADGEGGNVCASSGGSVLIRCGSIAGSGGVYARGGSCGGFSGSGGRIAIYAEDGDPFAFADHVSARCQDTDGSTCGTVYFEGPADTPGEGTLVIDNGGGNPGYRTPLTDDVEGAFEPFGRVVVRKGGHLQVAANRALRVTREIACSANGTIVSEDGTSAVEFVGDEEVTFTGGSLVDIAILKCVTPGKTIRFGTTAADKLTVGAGKNLIFKGVEGAPVSLLSTVDGTPWQIAMNPNPGVVEIDHVAVQDSNASSGAPMLAISSQDLGGNTNWGFSNPIVPGETITWTGGQSTKWDAAENWNLGRAPVDTDAIAIPSVGTGNYPVLPAGTYVFNRISVGEGASLTWKGCAVTITNDLVVAGTMAFTAGEPLYVEGNVTVTGGVTPATGSIYVTGAGDQTLDFGETTLYKIQFDKPSGNVSFGAHGFTATQFNCQATTEIAFAFAAGCTYEIPQFLVNGLSGEDRLVTLQSSEPGTKWLLVTTAAGQNVAGVNARDSDATGGDVVYGGTMSRQTDCLGWDTESDVASWLGGSGDITDPAKWSSGTVPGPDTLVTISAGDGVTLTATLPAGSPLTVKQLVVYAGTGGKATFAANAPLTVREDVVIRAGGVLELNAHDDYGEAPNVVTGNVTIASGGVLSHSGPLKTEENKLHLKVLGEMTVDAGGSVSVTGKGYTFISNDKAARGTNTFGPGSGRDNGRHGGYTHTGYETGVCYGSIRNPTNHGSSVSWTGKASPGSIHLVVPGTLTVNGTIAANGEGGNVCASSGGSVWVECGTLAGAGHITANGGTCGDYSGSGGRVAVVVTESNVHEGKITAQCESGGATCGTVYIEEPGDVPGQGTLVIDNCGHNNNVKGTYYWTPLNPTIQGLSEPFGKVEVKGYGRLVLEAGTTLKVVKGLELASNGYLNMAADAAVEFVGEDEATFTGAKNATIAALVCTNVAKTILFGTTAQDAITLPANARFVMRGPDAEHPVNLWPAAADGKWSVTLDNDAVTDVLYASVSNSTASANITAIDSQDLGGNTMWSFSSVIHPGDVITWTGAVSTEWKEGKNWEPAREPVDTDDVRIGRTSGNYPVLPSGNYSFNKVTVSSEAQLTLDGCNLTVTNALRVAGGLVFAGDETLTLAGSADFAGGTVTRARESVVIAGADNQVCDFGGSRFNKITVARPQGGYVSFGASGFGTATFNCSAAVPVTLVFAAGETYAADGLYLNGVQGESRLVTLESSESGTAWKLVAGAAQGVAGVTVADCDASAGETVYAGTTSAPSGANNRNWDFERDVASWVGGATGNFTDAANWASGKVPTDTTHVMLHAGDGETVAVTVPSGKPVAVATLKVDAGDGGSAQLTAKAALTVVGDVTLGAGGTLVLDCYDDAGAAPNTFGGDLEVRSGGRITHTGGTATESAKLHLSVAGDALVAAGGSIDGNTKGYNSDVAHGPGGGGMGTGSSHAGYSANNSAAPYGSILRPVTWGSANCYSIGGGAVHLIVGGTLTVEGEIAADGRRNNTYYTACGGSVWIECGKLCGSGRVSAKDGLTDSRTEGYTSSGGRIAIYQRQAKDFDAFPLAQLATTFYGLNAAGTIYLACDGNRTSDLYIGQPVEFLAAKQKTQFPMPADGDMEKLYRDVNLIIGPHAWVTLPEKASVLVRDVELQDKDSRLYVNGGQLRIRSLRHKDGKRWYKPLADEIADKKVELGGTVANPGKIEWIGGVDGTVLIVK